jgi:hypothetical protein
MTDYSDAIVAEYLRRLDQAAAGLPPDRRAELVGEIAEHISHARASGQAADEAGLRSLLDRLGEPSDIVAEADEGAEGGDSPPPGPPGTPGAGGGVGPGGFAPQIVSTRRPSIGVEVAAVLLMTVGSIVPVLGWMVGAVLLWTSRRLRAWEKVLMTLVVPGGPFIVIFLVGLVPTQSCSTYSSTDSAGNSIQGPTTCTGFALPLWVGIPLLVLTLVGPFVVGGILLKHAGDRAALEPPIPVYAPMPGPYGAGASRWGGLEIAAVLLLSVGSLVPVAGPIAGLVCTWMSNAWTTAEKWVATAIMAAVLVIPVAGILAFRL